MLLPAETVSLYSLPLRPVCNTPVSPWLTCRQCLNLPGKGDNTLMAAALAALSDCRNGTTDSFQGLNITKTKAPKVGNPLFNFTANTTIQRRDSDEVDRLFPNLFLGESSAGIKSAFVEFRTVVVFVLLGMAIGLAE